MKYSQQELVEYWRTTYDWRKWEAKLNELQQYTTPIQAGALRAAPGRRSNARWGGVPGSCGGGAGVVPGQITAVGAALHAHVGTGTNRPALLGSGAPRLPHQLPRSNPYCKPAWAIRRNPRRTPSPILSDPILSYPSS